MSYDLDGDGVVGNRDYVLAKLFDKDQDGKLNQQERKNAEDAIKQVSKVTFNLQFMCDFLIYAFYRDSTRN